MFHRHDWVTTHKKMGSMVFTNYFLGYQRRIVMFTIQTCSCCGKSRAYWKDVNGAKGKLSPEFMRQAINKGII